jgi:hypothetical protein
MGGSIKIRAWVWDEKTSGTNAQNVSNSVFTTRDLNQEYDPSGVVTLSSDQFTFTIDGYVTWHCPYRDGCMSELYNVTDSVQTATSTSGESTGGSVALMVGRSKVVAGKTYRIGHRADNSTVPMGYGAGYGVEKYTLVIFEEE